MDVPMIEAAMALPLPCGKEMFISPEDARRVTPMSWSDRGDGYVRARWKKSLGGDGRIVYLHRFIMSAPDGYVVDHIDGNPLNNTRGNLQITSQSRNIMRAKTMSGGVTRLASWSNRWRARMRVDGKPVSLGCFDTEEDAWRAISAAREVVWNDTRINELGTKL